MRISAAQYQALTDSRAKKKNKFGAKKTMHPDGMFDSKSECQRYNFLLLQKMRGEIVGEIQRQVKFDLIVKDFKVCGFVADFVYTPRDHVEIVEDWKGFMTRASSIKHKLFFAIYGRRIYVAKNIRQWL